MKNPSTHPMSRMLGSLLMRIRPAPFAVAIKTLLGVRRIEVDTVEGKFWLDPASDFGQRLLNKGIYEPEMVATLKRFLRPGDAFADVGANEGYFSVVASRIVGTTGRVLAVEPQGRLQPVLMRNFEINGCRNATVTAAAVSDAAGVAELNLAPSMNTGASSLMQRTRYTPRRETVPTRTLDDIIKASGMGRVNLLKMDIEGWEYEAILGSRPLFEAGVIRAITVELHEDHLRARGLGIKPIVDFLTGCGYSRITESDTVVFALPDGNP
jgi:FkbM family methyltransferase